MGNEWEVVFTIFILSFWILFPVGMFLSMNHVDKNTDQVIQLEKIRHLPVGQARSDPQVGEFKRPVKITRPLGKAS